MPVKASSVFNTVVSPSRRRHPTVSCSVYDMEEGGGLDPQRVKRPSAFQAEPVPDEFTLQWCVLVGPQAAASAGWKPPRTARSAT